jgi:hypothetical protein
MKRLVRSVVNPRTFLFRVEENGAAVSWKGFAQLLAGNAQFQDEMTSAIVETDFAAVFFETRPTVSERFEFIVADAPQLERAASYTQMEQFSAQMEANKGAVASSFFNLGRDAVLIVPNPDKRLEDEASYRHLANFCRIPLVDLTRGFWSKVGKVMLEQLESEPGRPLWLSTSGLGVYYLHMRVDTVPKYYTFAPFKNLN